MRQSCGTRSPSTLLLFPLYCPHCFRARAHTPSPTARALFPHRQRTAAAPPLHIPSQPLSAADDTPCALPAIKRSVTASSTIPPQQLSFYACSLRSLGIVAKRATLVCLVLSTTFSDLRSFCVAWGAMQRRVAEALKHERLSHSSGTSLRSSVY